MSGRITHIGPGSARRRLKAEDGPRLRPLQRRRLQRDDDLPEEDEAGFIPERPPERLAEPPLPAPEVELPAAPPAPEPEIEIPEGQDDLPPAEEDPQPLGRRARRRAAERQATVVQTLPTAGPARMRPRHRGLMLSFLLIVVMPFLLASAYLWGLAEDQYASTVGFTVRSETGATSATELLGGLAQLGSSSGGSEADILYEFIQSPEIVAQVDERVGLSSVYSEHWPGDPLYALWPDATIEDLLWYWNRVVRISYDAGTRLIELRVVAPEPDQAQMIATEILAASQRKINALNDQARSDAMRYATEDLNSSVQRLKDAREALSRFRSRTQIVDPAADLQGRMGVLNNLQQQLAQALIENDIVMATTQEGDPRREQATRRIQVIRDRIAAERQSFASDQNQQGVGGTYPDLLAEFESLTVDMQFAEQTYRASLASVDVARANAQRQSLYLAAYVNPTLPQVAEYPQRLLTSGLIGLFLLLAWSIMALVYYSIRDRR